jgi:hypothetical protein
LTTLRRIWLTGDKEKSAMNDSLRSARDDLAFMKELAEDRGPLPAHLGQHIFWPGLLYGLNVIATWAGLSGLIPWPADWQAWAYLPATVIYIPICLIVNLRARRQSWGPAARMFAAAWSGVALLTFTVVTVVVIASYRAGVNYAVVWPSFALAMYGGSWLVMGILLKRMWALLVAFGCCATAIAMGFLIDMPELWLVMGLGMLFFMALPGFVMMRPKRAAQ